MLANPVTDDVLLSSDGAASQILESPASVCSLLAPDEAKLNRFHAFLARLLNVAPRVVGSVASAIVHTDVLGKKLVDRTWLEVATELLDAALVCSWPRQDVAIYLGRRNKLLYADATGLMHMKAILTSPFNNNLLSLARLTELVPPLNYELVAVIDDVSGSYKRVYEGLDTQTFKRVALKQYRQLDGTTIRLMMAKNAIAGLQDAYRRDLLPWSRLSFAHPNVLRPIPVAHPANEFWLAEDIIEQTLEKRLAMASSGLPAYDVLQIGRDLTAGLAHCHAHNLVHGDIKLDNIGCIRDTYALFDFGIATLVSAEQNARDYPGTTRTRAPEMWHRNVHPTKEADVWALAACLLCLLTRTYPFVDFDKTVPKPDDAGRSAYESELKLRVSNGERDIQSRIKGCLDADWWALLHECFAYEPTRRPTADDLHSRISARLRQFPEAGSHPSSK